MFPRTRAWSLRLVECSLKKNKSVSSEAINGVEESAAVILAKQQDMEPESKSSLPCCSMASKREMVLGKAGLAGW